VVTPKGVHLERTYAEYLETGFAKAEPQQGFDSCQGCHMDTTLPPQPIAVVQGMELPDRLLHEHLWAAVDVALTDDFPDQDVQELAVLCALANGTSLSEFAANDIGNEFTITIETDAGHAQPSGAAQDRRLWLEFVAYDDAGKVIFESGRPAAGEPLDPASDPYLTVFRDHVYDELGREVHMFWDAAPSEMWPLGYDPDANILPFATTPLEPHAIKLTFPLSVLPARVEARLMIRPVGLDILQDLVASGDLDEDVLERMPTFPLYGTAVEWTRDQGPEPITVPKRPPIRCPDDYLELLAK
jgi:hypothetical protein